jgi:hypothetical protein
MIKHRCKLYARGRFLGSTALDPEFCKSSECLELQLRKISRLSRWIACRVLTCQTWSPRLRLVEVDDPKGGH